MMYEIIWMESVVTYRIIYFIVVLKISFFPGDDVDVDMGNCLASLRTILINTNSYKSGATSSSIEY